MASVFISITLAPTERNVGHLSRSDSAAAIYPLTLRLGRRKLISRSRLRLPPDRSLQLLQLIGLFPLRPVLCHAGSGTGEWGEITLAARK